MDIEAIR